MSFLSSRFLQLVLINCIKLFGTFIYLVCVDKIEEIGRKIKETRLKRLILGSRKKIINLDYRLDSLDSLDLSG